MSTPPPRLRIILIGGTSHAGKSTVARQLASILEWECLSTDRLAKHPGRPWRHDGTAVPGHVADHYAKLAVEKLIADVLRHYEQNVVPQVELLVRARASSASTPGLVLEGSAILPESILRLVSDQVAALWLTAGDELLASRIHDESRYGQRPGHERFLIDQFLERTLGFGHRIDRALMAHGLMRIHVAEEDSPEAVARRCLQAIASERGCNT